MNQSNNTNNMELEHTPTLLDAPPTPWEEDDPFPDTIETPTPSIQSVTEMLIEVEQAKLAQMKLAGETDEKLKQQWEAQNNWGVFAVVAMRPTTYSSSKTGKTAFMAWCPRPDANSLQWVSGRKEALENAYKKAQLVLDMPPDLRSLFLSYNVMGPFEMAGPVMAERACHDREGERRTVFRVSTRIFKKGTKQMHITQVLSTGRSVAPKQDSFEERFPGGIVPWKKIMEAADKKGVTKEMGTLLSSHVATAAIADAMDEID